MEKISSICTILDFMFNLKDDFVGSNPTTVYQSGVSCLVEHTAELLF
ncbi:MAG: hypothetical protein LKF42_00480 [Streptococcaceae bacterium]|jgi:hypothetical protein|nr:hypothetical protein [Streptococcaceae bacterium]MCH4176208.1 hypothetical protein [Streptococcaceae bacterium]